MPFCAALAGSSGQISLALLPNLIASFWGCGVALLGRGHQLRIDDLTAHRQVSALLELPVEVGEHRVERARFGQRLAKQADRVGIGRRRAQVEAQEPQPDEPVPDQILHPRIGEIILRRQHQHLEHRHSIIRRPAALRPVATGQSRNQTRAKCLEVDDPA